jgi:peptidoglycan biosynthesis protein MviN/MurJ (putative lipid II flippase)
LCLQVLLACALMAGGLGWAAQNWDWTGLQSLAWQRAGLMFLVLVASSVVYFATLRVIGVDLRALLRR